MVTRHPILRRIALMLVFAALLLAGGRYFAAKGNAPPAERPQLVTIPAGDITLRPMGSFAQDGKTVIPPLKTVQVSKFEIMKYQVSRDQYAQCVLAGVCAPVPTASGHVPQTMVSWIDASTYAGWLSERTGEDWHLPSTRQWLRAAAERAGDVFLGFDETADTLDPGARMLTQYKSGTLLRGTRSTILRPAGGFGLNSLGVADMAGNIWEWTDGCLANGTVQADGSVVFSAEYCGVRIAGGAHTAAVINFVRDASVGGCAVGLPPDHLGFRLVRAR